MKMKTITVEEARRVEDHLEDQNHHTQSIMVACCLAYNHEWLWQSDLKQSLELLSEIDERHNKLGHIADKDYFLRSCIYARATKFADRDREATEVAIPAEVYELYHSILI